MCEQNTSYLVKHIRISGKKILQNLPKNCSKSTKIAIAIRKFLKFSGGVCPQTNQERFLFHDLLQDNSAERILFKKCQSLVSLS